jgi:hypothetical protein
MVVAEDRLNGELIPEAGFPTGLEVVCREEMMVCDGLMSWPRRCVGPRHATPQRACLAPKLDGGLAPLNGPLLAIFVAVGASR